MSGAGARAVGGAPSEAPAIPVELLQETGR